VIDPHQPAPHQPPPPPLRFQRLAEQVADDLRRQILLGNLVDGAELPKEEDLRAAYPVSKPTLREAMRILEAEGLVTVRRGSIGGAVVHRPAAANVAYTLGMVLVAEQVDMGDVGVALRQVEPACAALCALRPDRATAVVPVLRRLYSRSVEVVDDLVEVTSSSRQFHEALVDLCGNHSLIIMAGALEALWSNHESGWAQSVGAASEISRAERLEALEVHAHLIDAIEAGDVEAVRLLAAEHLASSQQYPQRQTDAERLDPGAVRDFFVRRNTSA
jgi:GntR family transcriptional repressor for pyruvate dehydrogenase complex